MFVVEQIVSGDPSTSGSDRASERDYIVTRKKISLIIGIIKNLSESVYSTITLVLAISIFQFLFPWIDKSKIWPCDDFSNTLKKFAMKSFSLISSICVKSENFAMTQLPGGQSCHQVIY